MISLVPVDEGGDKKNPDGQITDTIRQYLYHWPLFCISVLITVSAAFFYLKNVNPTYEIKARLLIKDHLRGVSAEPALAELDFIRTNSVIENELEILKSRPLMSRVVEDLQLWTTYERVEGMFNEDLYRSTPVRLVLLSGERDEIMPHTFRITVVDKDRFLLTQGKNTYPVKFSSRLIVGAHTYQLIPTGHLPRYRGSDLQISVFSPQAATSLYLSKIITSPISKLASMLEIKMKDNVPQRGTDILNKLIYEYDLASVQYKNRVTESTLKFMDVRLDSLSRELAALERSVAQFKSSKALTEISAKSEFFLQNARENDQRKNEVDVQLKVIEDLEQYISTSNPDASPSTTGISDPNLASLIEQLTALELQRSRLLATTPEKNPVIQTINNQIRSLKNTIRDNIRGIKASLLATRRQLSTFESGLDATIRDIPVEEREYISIKRQQSIKEELYVYLLKKREEAGLSYASTLADSRTVDKAFYGAPVSPNPPMILGAAFLLGLVIPVGIVFGRNLLNDRILHSKTIRETTSVPIIAEIIQHDNSRAFALTDGNSRVLAEQFRILRTNLNYLCDIKGRGRVTMLTSGMASEGKSFICCNLGLAMAAYDRKTVILEFDLRRPGISKHFELGSTTGLSEFLNSEATKDEIVQRSDIHPNLYVIRAGALPPNPSDLLGDQKMRDLMDWLRYHFDDIIIDTPPIHLVADAMIISQFSDINLYVIRQAFTQRSELEFIRQLKDDGKLKNMNIIFNGVEMGSRYNYKVNFNYQYYSGSRPRRLSMSSAIKAVIKRF